MTEQAGTITLSAAHYAALRSCSNLLGLMLLEPASVPNPQLQARIASRARAAVNAVDGRQGSDPWAEQLLALAS